MLCKWGEKRIFVGGCENNVQETRERVRETKGALLIAVSHLDHVRSGTKTLLERSFEEATHLSFVVLGLDNFDRTYGKA